MRRVAAACSSNNCTPIDRGLLVVALLAACATVGCSNSTPAPQDGTITAASSTTPVARKELPAKFKSVVIFVESLRQDLPPDNKSKGKTECSTTFKPSDAKSVKQSLICGFPGAVSTVGWEFLTTSADGDHYRFDRHFPVEDGKASESATVIYRGDDLLVFEDEQQKIGMRPPNAE
jgi:hypothetical protein